MTNKEKVIALIHSLPDDKAEQLLKFVKEEMKTPFRKVVYSIKNTATGKEYIGMTGNLERRIRYHMSRLKNGKHFVEDMQSDFNKHGDCFTVSVIEEVNCSLLKRREFELIESRKTYIRENGYNYKDRIFEKWRVAKKTV